jgi:hypothetical protein
MLICATSENPEVLYFRMPLPQAPDLAFRIHSPGSVHPILDILCAITQDLRETMTEIRASESSTPDDSISINYASITESQAVGRVGCRANTRLDANPLSAEQLDACADVDEVATAAIDEMGYQVRLRAVGHLKSGFGEVGVSIAMKYEHVEFIVGGRLTAPQLPVWHV